MSIHDDMTHCASADEMVDVSSRDECDAEMYDEPGEMNDSEIEAIRAEVLAEEVRLLREALPSVPDIRRSLRKAFGTEGEVFGRSLESTMRGRKALTDSHEGSAA